MRRCFVISPIGTRDSEIREHADDVYDYIIKPAMDECEIEAVRSDHMREAGKITEQMFQEIFADDMCIALLTGHNPNVFYELAVAQAAAKPVLILIDRSEELPFDVQDLRCIIYDLKPRALFDRTYVSEIVHYIRELERQEFAPVFPFGGMIPLGGPGSGFCFMDRCQEFGTTDKGRQLLADTHERFDVMGTTLHIWRRGNYFANLLAEKAAGGCRARIMILDPAHPALSAFASASTPEEPLDSLVRRLQEMQEYFAAVAAQADGIEFRQIKRGLPHGELTVTDESAVYIQYLAGEPTVNSPLWQAPAKTALYAKMRHEFDTLWALNA